MRNMGSKLTETGIDLPTIMGRVGHDDIETTMGVYTHVTNKMKNRSMENLSLVMDIYSKKIIYKINIYFPSKKRGLPIGKPRYIKHYLLWLTSCPAWFATYNMMK